MKVQIVRVDGLARRHGRVALRDRLEGNWTRWQVVCRLRALAAKLPTVKAYSIWVNGEWCYTHAARR